MTRTSSMQRAIEPMDTNPNSVRRSFYIPNLSNMKVAAVALFFFAMANMPTADAGPIAYGTCVAACGTITGISSGGTALPISVGICIKACWAAFVAPTP